MPRTAQTITVALVGVCALVSPVSGSAQGTPGAAVTVALEKELVTQHEPVLLRFTLRNSSSKQAVFELGYGEEKANVKVTVTDPDGRLWPKPRPVPQFGFKETILAEPFSTSVRSIVLNDWFTFDKLGRYRIDMAVPPSTGSSPANLQIPDTPLTLTVLPRDEVALAASCADLVRRLENRKSAADADAAANALSKVDDPVAVPFLAKAMKQKLFSSMMIGALGRLNAPGAINALIAASHSSDPEISSLARATLVALKRDRRSR